MPSSSSDETIVAPRKKPPTRKEPHPAQPQVIIFALNQRSQVHRAGGKRTRNGCITCKRRHVKCDETKPKCKRCLSFRDGRCQGYDDVSEGASITRTDEDSRRLRQPGYETLIFSNSGELNYFDFWRNLVGRIYLFPSENMAQVLPQLALQSPAIKHAALAAAAMARAIIPNLKRKTRDQLKGNGPHYELALKHYGLAIHLLRTSQVDKDNLLLAIITCVIFVMFECLHGDRNAALGHINHGYKMMDHYLESRSFLEDSHATDSVKMLCDDVAWIFHGLTMQAWTHNILHSKDEIQWCCRGRNRQFAVDEVPDTFGTIHSARRWWRVTQHHILHHCPIFTGLHVTGMTSQMLVGSYAGNWAQRKQGQQDLLGVRDEHLGYLDRWQDAFQPLWDKIQNELSADNQAFVEACGLQAQFLLLKKDILSKHSNAIDDIEDVTPPFAEIVRLTKVTLAAQSNCNGCTDVFSMDNGPTWLLFATAMRCRDRDVREEAIGLLEKYPRRDGLWDSRTFLAMTRRNRGVEITEGLDQYANDPEGRMTQREAYFDQDGVVSGIIRTKDPVSSKWKAMRVELLDG